MMGGLRKGLGEAVHPDRRIQGRDVITREGDEGDAAYLIVSSEGEVLIGSGGRRMSSGRSGRDVRRDAPDEPGLRSATVKALTDTECRAASAEEFIE
jgi:CRP-like cAMP-binding protein